MVIRSETLRGFMLAHKVEGIRRWGFCGVVEFIKLLGLMGIIKPIKP